MINFNSKLQTYFPVTDKPVEVICKIISHGSNCNATADLNK